MSEERRVIPIAIAEERTDGACSGAESFALMVIGDSMEPEFVDGDVIIVEPGGLAGDGAYVLAQHEEQWTFRQLRRQGEAWCLQALNPAYPAIELPDLAGVRGVVVQKSKPGQRSATKSYVE